MTAETTETLPDYRATLRLPRTDFPMRAGLPAKEPEILARWARLKLYARLRQAAQGREKYILHDGPPYANGGIHIGTALNKILKDVVTRSMQMLGHDSNYVPGWDCHGLPIEWKIEEENYRGKGKAKPDLTHPTATIAFRQECRAYAEHWLGVQRDEFQRLGVEGDWDNAYTTMSFAAEARIAAELMKFATTGQLYRGSKPVMWSVVEKTALAEAEVEYHEITSPAIWVKFPIYSGVSRTTTAGAAGQNIPVRTVSPNVLPNDLRGAYIVIWTTTPWTIPGNRLIAYSKDIVYGLYEITAVREDNWTKQGERLVIADMLAESVLRAARIDSYKRLRQVDPSTISDCLHPLHKQGYKTLRFTVHVFAADFVTEDTGTGFVHVAPGHGADDYNLWTAKRLGEVPNTVGPDGRYYDHVPLFAGACVIDENGKFGDANTKVIEALKSANALVAQGPFKHEYPHSWRSKAPLIFRNTPQWFIAMDKALSDQIIKFSEDSPLGVGDTLRMRALKAIAETRFVPAAGRNRIQGMIENRPDWVVSRQRAWGVPITVFRNTDKDSKFEGELLPGSRPDWKKESEKLSRRIAEVFEAEGADAWFAEGARERFLDGIVDDPDDWEQVTDILDVWFDSGATHAFVLETRDDLKWPASLYLEGSDQHRGWFHSSLLESCGTRGRAPYEAVLTHGFVLAEDGRKMSKSLGNQVQPQKIVEQYGADILRLWVMSSDYAEDLRIGPEIIKSNADAYRRLRNTIRFMLGNLTGFAEAERLPVADMPELERWVLHRLWQLDARVRQGYEDFAFQPIFSALFNFCTVDLSSVYFDIRKDALYCDREASKRRRAARTVLDHLFNCVVAWLAPMLCFTAEEAWLTRFPGEQESVHLKLFPEVPEEWRDDALAEKFAHVRAVRRVVTGALELERAEKRIGASLEAAPILYLSDPDLLAALEGLDMAEICIASSFDIRPLEAAPAGAFRLAEAGDKAAVEIVPAKGAKCARCWMILPDVGSHRQAPGTCRRCAEAIAAG